MSDIISLIVKEDIVAPFELRQVASTSPFILTDSPQDDITLVETPTVTGSVELVGPKGDTGPQLKGISLFCSGRPLNGEIIGGGLSPYNFTIDSLNSEAKAKVAPTANTVFEIKNNDVIIGTITFEAGILEGTVNITTPIVLANSYITVHTPANADLTLSDIGIIIRE